MLSELDYLSMKYKCVFNYIIICEVNWLKILTAYLIPDVQNSIQVSSAYIYRFAKEKVELFYQSVLRCIIFQSR